jgi:D-glycero-alpha-D-manno-heptose-7-phosphate kinase
MIGTITLDSGMKESPQKIRARAPLRLGFAGGGTDVSPYSDKYGGFVLNAAIDKFAHAAITTRDDGLVELLAPDTGVSWTGPVSETLPTVKGLELHTGVYNRMRRKFGWDESVSISLTTQSEAPPGSGLGSSSAMVVAMVQAFRDFLALPLGAYEIAELAYEIERIDLGFPGGKQDHYTAAFGGLNFMEFYGDRVVVNPLRLKKNYQLELESSLLLFYTAVSRKSANIISEQMFNVKGGNENSVQAMHNLKAQALHMKEALLKGDFEAITTAMRASWSAKKRMASTISNEKIDAIYDAAVKEGAHAGKVSGAGGGGFMMFLVDPAKRQHIIQCLRQFPGFVSNCNFVGRGAHSWRVT